jgi:16S rRNA (cytosine967-C5)-methyltransferase
VTERALGARQAEQSAILDDAARYAKSGGRVVYVTCSLLPQENEDQITAFVAAHPEYEIIPPADVVAAADVGSGLAEAALVRPNGLVLSPHRTATDGFFISVLRKQ